MSDIIKELVVYGVGFDGFQLLLDVFHVIVRVAQFDDVAGIAHDDGFAIILDLHFDEKTPLRLSFS